MGMGGSHSDSCKGLPQQCYGARPRAKVLGRWLSKDQLIAPSEVIVAPPAEYCPTSPALTCLIILTPWR